MYFSQFNWWSFVAKETETDIENNLCDLVTLKISIFDTNFAEFLTACLQIKCDVFETPLKWNFKLFVYIYIFREMRCLRNKIHTNLFFTFVLSNACWIGTAVIQVSSNVLFLMLLLLFFCCCWCCCFCCCWLVSAA